MYSFSFGCNVHWPAVSLGNVQCRSVFLLYCKTRCICLLHWATGLLHWSRKWSVHSGLRPASVALRLAILFPSHRKTRCSVQFFCCIETHSETCLCVWLETESVVYNEQCTMQVWVAENLSTVYDIDSKLYGVHCPTYNMQLFWECSAVRQIT